MAAVLAKASPSAWKRLKSHRAALFGLIVICALVVIAIGAPKVAPADPNRQDIMNRLAKPGTPMAQDLGGEMYVLGGDQLGRDLLSRVIYGSRISLTVGVVAQSIILIIGVTAGSIAGYFGGWIDRIIMRICDILFAFPDLLFAIAIMFALGRGLINLFIALAVVNWAGMARLVRAQVLQLRERDFVEAARSAGAPPHWIIIRHILPNALGPIIVAATLGVPGAILSEAGLSFLGLGVQPPTATWGAMIFDGRAYLRVAPALSVVPGIAIMVTVLAFNLLGDGLRDALDPRIRR